VVVIIIALYFLCNVLFNKASHITNLESDEVREASAKRSSLRPDPVSAVADFEDASDSTRLQNLRFDAVDNAGGGILNFEALSKPRTTQLSSGVGSNFARENATLMYKSAKWISAYKEMCAMITVDELELDGAATVASKLLEGSVPMATIKAALSAEDADNSGTCSTVEFIYAMKKLVKL